MSRHDSRARAERVVLLRAVLREPWREIMRSENFGAAVATWPPLTPEQRAKVVTLFASKLHDHLTCGNGIATRQPGASGLARKTPLTWVNAGAPAGFEPASGFRRACEPS